MNTTVVRAPVSLVLDPGLSPSAKLIWMVLRLHADRPPAAPALLEARTGLSRKTILKGLAQLAATGWYSAAPGQPTCAIDQAPSGRRVSIPGDLLSDRRVGVQGRILYGHLQLTPKFRHPAGHFTYTSVSRLAGAMPKTVRRAVTELVTPGWLAITQKNRLAAVQFSVLDPGAARGEAEVTRALQRLNEAPFFGEALMREYLTLLVDSDDFEDDSAPGFLVNPGTNERMELDRHYSHRAAFEFNGPQHYGATDQFSAQHAAKQRARDDIKHGICVTRGIGLVIIHPEDLTMETMRAKIGRLLPLRDLLGHERLIAFLEAVGRRYRLAAKRGRLSAAAAEDRAD